MSTSLWFRSGLGSVSGLGLGWSLARLSNDLLGTAGLGLGCALLIPPLSAGSNWAARIRAAVLHGAWMAGAILLGLGVHRPLDALLFVLVDVALLALACHGARLRVAPIGLCLMLSGTLARAECPTQAPLFGLPLAPTLDKAVPVDNLRRFAFESDAHRTDAVVVLRDGELVFEAYAHGFTASMPHLAWSVSKSISSALLGVAIQEGRLTLSDSICDHLDAPEDKCGIQVLDLLRWSSGLDWTETYEEDESAQASSVLAMLYGEGRRDMARFVLEHPFRAPPGATWMYSSGDAHLMMAVVGAAMEPHHGALFPWSVLFDTLGMEGAVFEQDAAGDYVGASYFHGTARDLARFGQLYVQDGCWNGKRILPEGWVKDAGQVSAPFSIKRVARSDPRDVGGRSWWLNRPVPEANIEKPWPSIPEDALVARGHWGQFVIVAPRQRVVAVRLGEDRDGLRFDLDAFARLAFTAAGVLP
ncbi:MAG: serine hydrolase [Myxococcota bacterium]